MDTVSKLCVHTRRSRSIGRILNLECISGSIHTKFSACTSISRVYSCPGGDRRGLPVTADSRTAVPNARPGLTDLYTGLVHVYVVPEVLWSPSSAVVSAHPCAPAAAG